MKKLIIFLILITITSTLSIKKVEAKSTSFYEGEYIPNIWMNKKNPKDGLTYYNQARFIRENTTNNIAYCLEPFIFFQNNNYYEGTKNPINYTKEQISNMILIAHFGYGYKNHTEPKWYAITQFMLWKVAEPNAYYYFSTYKNGPEVSLFQNEMNEINTLINNYKKKPSFDNKTYYIVENEQLSLIDTNNTLNDFKISTDIATIKNNKLITNQLTSGTYTINLKKENILYNRPILFYQSSTNQDLIDTGDPTAITSKITIKVIKTTVTINKLDADNLTTEPQGDASLIGSTFDLYKENDEYIKTLTIEKETNELTNLPLGAYYLKEKTPGEGYQLNSEKHYFTLTKDNPEISIQITNKVIKGKLQIKKEYGYENNFKPEKNISFNIYDKNDELIKTIITNEEGLTEIILPYGKYKLEQISTTEGYRKIEPIYFEITNEETLYYNLKNYKIPVPNTKTESLFIKLLRILRKLLCGKKLLY